MASVDGPKAQDTDTLVNQMCGPCKMTDGSMKEAQQYCRECSEYLCDSCVEYHKEHSSLKSDNVDGTTAVSLDSDLHRTITCGCNKNKQVDFYCEEHCDVICSVCKTFKHYNCQLSPIQEKSSGYNIEMLEFIMSRMESLNIKFDQLKEECNRNEKELKRSKETCKKEIMAFRKELDIFLVKFEQEMLAELEQLESEEHQRISGQISTLTTARQMLEADYQILNNAKKDGYKHIMFAAEVQTSRSFRGCDKILRDLENDVSKITISFEKNKELHALQNKITGLGSLQTSESIYGRRHKSVVLGQNVDQRNVVNVRCYDDKEEPWITGCAVMPDDSVVICDHNNCKLKLLNHAFLMNESYPMPECPWGISVLDADNVIVSIPDEKKLQHIQVFPRLKAGHIIQMDKSCYGVEVSGDRIYVSCHNTPGAGEVRVLDKQGNLQQRLGFNNDRSFKSSSSEFLFSIPFFITVDRDADKIFVSDRQNDTVTCMTADGNIIYKFTDRMLKAPRGLYCDDSNNVLVCCLDTSTVQVIAADGKLYETILSTKDGLKRPESIAYRRSDNVLLVGCKTLDHLLVYHLGFGTEL